MARPKKEPVDPARLTNDERLEAMRQLTAAKRILEEAQGSYRLLGARLKAAGHDLKALIAVNAASRQDPAVVQAHETEKLRLMGLRNIVNLAELIEEADQLQVTPKARAAETAADAEEAGYRAGRNGVPVEDCPFPAGSDFGDRWRRWHADGVKVAQAGGGKQMTATRKPPKKEAGLTLAGGKGKGGGKGGRKKGPRLLTSSEVEQLADAQSPIN